MINPCLICNESDEKLVMEKCPPPELHLLMGACTSIYRCLNQVWPDLEKWFKKHGITVHGYHSGGLGKIFLKICIKNYHGHDHWCIGGGGQGGITVKLTNFGKIMLKNTLFATLMVGTP